MEVDGVTFEFVGAAAEEVVEAHLVERRGGSVRGDVAADVVFDTVGADHHGQRVPAYKALDAALEFLVAGIARLKAMGNRIGVWSVGGEG